MKPTGLLCLFPLLAVGCGGAVRAEFIAVETFESLELGAVDGQNSWSGGADATVAVDPQNDANQVLQLTSEAGNVRHPAQFSGPARMLYLRFRFTAEQKYSFGVSPYNYPTQYGDYAAELSMSNSSSELRVFNGVPGANYQTLAELTPDTWYNVWMLLDYDADTIQVWVHDRPGETALAGDRMANDDGETVFQFRAGANELRTLFLKTGGGSEDQPNPFYVDDIYLEDSSAVNLGNPSGITPAARIVDRYLFYNNSAFDADVLDVLADDRAIACDKSALLPGHQASIENYSSFNRGINGVMIDVADLPGDAALSPSDFDFLVGNSDRLAEWSAAPSPTDVQVRYGGGVDDSDRITLTWPDDAIADQWLMVRMRATQATGLPEDDVFLFGSARGETGNNLGNALITAADVVAVRDGARGAGNRAEIDDPCDFNRDGLVDNLDVLIARNGATSPFSALRLIDLSVAPAPQAVPEPTGVALALIGLLVVLARRRRGCLTP